MTVVGITGGTGAGKTTALTALRELGAAVIDCDAVYHELLRTDLAMLEAIEKRFPGVVTDGVLDRKALGRVVFASKEGLADLSAITWPFVDREVQARLRREAAAGRKLAAIDAIGLFESGMDRLCDVTVHVTAPEELRVRRVMARDGVSEDYARSRIAAQKPESFFKERCGHTLINDLDSEAGFLARCRVFFSKITGGRDMAELRDELFYKQENCYDLMDEQELSEAESYSRKYMDFMSVSRTEREAVSEGIRLAEAAGFHAYDGEGPLKPGEKIYRSIRGKMLLLAVVGKRPLDQGAHICAAHIDSPRLDLKEVPVYEDSEVAYFKTHYYGGLRKYQWVTIPLELHGVVMTKDGASHEVKLGADPSDPVLYISDLLPHLGTKQSREPLEKAINGEHLNVILGTRPMKEDDPKKDRVKLQILKLFNEKYGISETDFLSAELEIVPSYPVREVGLDRSLIGSYGHDDRVCAFAELRAILDIEDPELTAVCVLADKEEIGSMGATGMQSRAFECLMEDMCEAQNVKLRRCFERSLCISADVSVAYDPSWPEVFEKRNTCKLNYGLSIMKFTGHGGKGGANDASAEVVGRVRRILDDNKVVWQMGEIGKVDEGGGGTVALHMGNRNIDTIDAGVPVLAMHAPWELVAKLDCYMAYKGMKAVYMEVPCKE